MHNTQATVEPKLERQAEVPARLKKNGMLMPIFVVLIGITVLLYPVIATQWNNIQQQEVASEYKSFVKEADTSELEASSSVLTSTTRIVRWVLFLIRGRPVCPMTTSHSKSTCTSSTCRGRWRV